MQISREDGEKQRGADVPPHCPPDWMEKVWPPLLEGGGCAAVTGGG